MGRKKAQLNFSLGRFDLMCCAKNVPHFFFMQFAFMLATDNLNNCLFGSILLTAIKE